MTTSNAKFQLYCCGSRGSRPVGGRRFNEFGGFTSCYVLKKNDYALVIDCGTGLYEANAIVLDCSVIDVVLTHMHYDHILGMLDWTAIPKNAKVTFYGSFDDWFGKRSFDEFFRDPFWPVQPQFTIKQTQVNGEPLQLRKDLSISFYKAPHPNHAQIMIINSFEEEDGPRKIAVMFDNEESDSLDRELLRDCDYLLYDGMYTDAEYPSHKGYGHSTWQEGCRLAVHVACKRLTITHHDPDRTDEQLRQYEKLARDIYPNTDFARSGMSWVFPAEDTAVSETTEKKELPKGYRKLKEYIHDRFTSLLIFNKDRSAFVSIGAYSILGIVSVFMTIVNIATGQIPLMYSTLVFSFVCVLCIALNLMFHVDYLIVQTIFQICAFAVFAFFVLSGHPEGFSALWLLMLPVAGMFVFGKKRNTVLCLLMFLFLIFVFYTPLGKSLLRYEYTQSFMLRFPMAFFAFFLLSYFLETVRESTFNELENLKKSQSDIIADQTSELREQNFNMLRINSQLQLRNNMLAKKVGKDLSDDEIRELLGDADTDKTGNENGL